MRAAPTILVGRAIPLAACGGSDTEVGTSAETTSSPAAAIAAAAKQTLDSGTARVTVTVEHTTSDRHWGIEAGERESTEGVVDLESHLVAFGDPARTVFERAFVYVKDDVEPDQPWRKHDYGRLSADERSLFLLRRYDPVHLVKLIASLDDFGPVPKIVGDQQIRGTATTHYDALVENEALTRALVPGGVSYAELVQSRAYPEPVSTYAPLEAWVGADGRLYKVLYDFDVFGSLFGERTIVELYDFGADVEIDVPSPDDTVDG